MSDPDIPSRPQSRRTPARNARRGFLIAVAALVTIGGLGAARWFNVGAEVAGEDLTAPEAMQAALDGSVTLIDIRRPDEWARTGVGQGARPIDMRRDDFIDALLRETDGVRDRPIALICARGVRSARLSARLQQAGFTRILDVPEGMLGSGAGPGWLKRGLPVTKP